MTSNLWCYLIVFIKECQHDGITLTRTLFVTCFRLYKGRSGYYLVAHECFKVNGAPSNHMMESALLSCEFKSRLGIQPNMVDTLHWQHPSLLVGRGGGSSASTEGYTLFLRDNTEDGRELADQFRSQSNSSRYYPNLPSLSFTSLFNLQPHDSILL